MTGYNDCALGDATVQAVMAEAWGVIYDIGEGKDFEVYSCHVSTDNERLATAAGDGHVRIWSTNAILNSTEDSDGKPRQLAAISHHSGTIHVVRFSPNNKYLASGADDKVVCIYAKDNGAPALPAFGSNEPLPSENWRLQRRLIGHDNDVQDIAWSYDSTVLVSVGLDSKVVVWSGHSFEKLKTLSHHQSLVKGVTFDPANKYFATASDDRTIKIFRFTSPSSNATAQDQANNFTLETTISAPFRGSPLTTYFRRCSWSPDGVHVAAADAVNGPVSSVAIITRGTWESDVNLIGHEGPVEVCAFSSRLFYTDPPSQGLEEAHPKMVTVVACAGQDKTLSIWNTSSSRPFLITHELTEKSISDLSWSSDGRTLFLTSLDGSIIVVAFDDGELGWPAPFHEVEKSLSKYGLGRKAGILESVEALRLEEKSKESELKVVQGRMGELMGDMRNDQLIHDTSGEKRVSNGVVRELAAEQPLNGTLPANTNTEATEEHRDSDPRIERLKQRVTITKDGKKRIAPILVSSTSGAAQSLLPQSQLLSGKGQTTRSDSPHNIIDLSKPYDGLPKGGLAGLILGNKLRLTSPEAESEHDADHQHGPKWPSGITKILSEKDKQTSFGQNLSDNIHSHHLPQVLRPAMSNPSLAYSQVRLAVPLVRTLISRTSDGSAPVNAMPVEVGYDDGRTKDVCILEAHNPSGAGRSAKIANPEPAKIVCSRKGQLLWQDFLQRAALLMTGNPNFWAIASEDGLIYIWTPMGRRIISPLVLEAQPAILDCRGVWLLCISTAGLCHVWNIQELSSPHPPVSLGPILDIASQSPGPHLTSSPSVIFAKLNSRGHVVVALSNGDGYTYSSSLYAWQRLSDSWWAVGSQYWNATETGSNSIHSSTTPYTVDPEIDDCVRPENISAGIIPMLERNTTSQVLLRGRAYTLQKLIKYLLSNAAYEGFEASVSIAHLENRIAAALSLTAREEFHTYLVMYAKRIGAEGQKNKVDELLKSVAGTILFQKEPTTHEGESNGLWWRGKNNLCGLDRRDLLNEIVTILGKHRDLQRIVLPYARLLNDEDDGTEETDSMAMDT